MAVSLRISRCLLGFGLLLSNTQVIAGHPTEDTESLGEALFLHNWARPETWTRPEPLGEGGDGLGPVFNEVSCVACHSIAGLGGAGGNEHNVDLLSIAFPKGSPSPRRSGLIRQAKELHSQLAPGNTRVILHEFGFGTGGDTQSYDVWRTSFLDESAVDGDRLSMDQPTAVIQGVPFRLSQRNTPALWGMGLIERLRRGPGNRLRRDLVLAQNGSSSGVSGRIPRTANGRAAWFGWRGHVEHLPEFVMSACANELGLAVSNHPQPESPVGERRGPKAARVLDLTNAQVVALTRYVGSLPRPQQVFPEDPGALSDIYAGEKVFDSVGCAQCHVRDLGPAEQIFSDLLLHDMGVSLSDPSTAFPERASVSRTKRNGSYSGGTSPEPSSPGARPIIRTNLAQEWRTPPLWGVADSPPYLHDGRAETLDEAIRLHDGEARSARHAYLDLPETERSQLLAFLGSLRAPQVVGSLNDVQPEEN